MPYGIYDSWPGALLYKYDKAFRELPGSGNFLAPKTSWLHACENDSWLGCSPQRPPMTSASGRGQADEADEAAEDNAYNVIIDTINAAHDVSALRLQS